MNTSLLAMCNMLFGGKSFSVVRKPDWNGGHYHEIEPYDYECKDFEYISWCGTPMEFAQQMPTFTNHVEPFHEKPTDYVETAENIVKWEIKRKFK